MPMRKCLECSREFSTRLPASRAAVTCSDECRARRRARKVREYNATRPYVPVPTVKRRCSCEVCGEVFHTNRPTQRFCSPRCRETAKDRRRPTRPCARCGAPVKGARGVRGRAIRYCSRRCHALDNPKPEIAKATPLRWAECAQCGRWFIKHGSRRVLCDSEVCSHAAKLAWSRARQYVPVVQRAYVCDECGQGCTTSNPRQRFCSSRCSGRDARRRRRIRQRAKGRRTEGNRIAQAQRRAERERDAYRANVSPRRIYERDRWICQLCGDPVDCVAEVPSPLAPTLDHIVPLARGGTHEPANVQLAHFLCNSRKGDRVR
jgi:endogenous inhibitor of DNA gyrase (YacG/DUF329 family)